MKTQPPVRKHENTLAPRRQESVGDQVVEYRGHLCERNVLESIVDKEKSNAVGPCAGARRCVYSDGSGITEVSDCLQ